MFNGELGYVLAGEEPAPSSMDVLALTNESGATTAGAPSCRTRAGVPAQNLH